MSHFHLPLVFLMFYGSNLQAEQSVEFGDFEVHHSIFNSTFLSPAIATKYSLRRGGSIAVMNISVMEKESAVSLPLKGTYTNLLGQVFELFFREIKDGIAVYSIAVFNFDDGDILNFTIKVTFPHGDEQIYLRKKMYRNRS